MSNLNIPTAEVFEPLLEPSRYKGAHGGRGSGKSYFFADKIIDDCMYYKPLSVVCVREIQKDLKHSAYKLITDRLAHYGLGEKDGWKVFKSEIETPGDGVMMFQGMQDHTSESIKSLEGFDRAWVEEAQTLSSKSLDLLRPTIRAKDSEIWFSWNPRRKIDPVDKLLRQGELPSSASVVQANWSDNPWFTEELELERQDCLRLEPDKYDHIWGGGYVSIVEGAYFAKHLAKAREEQRIGAVAADPYLTYRLYADIGGTGAKADAFVFWVAQFVGPQIRVLNHYEVQGQEIGHHLNWMREQGYTTANSKIWLPHDGETHDRVFAVSYQSAFKKAGYQVEVIPNQGKGAAMQRVNQVRRLFPNVWFNEATTQAGREALGWYHEKIDEQRNVGLGPDHDWSSHTADAFGLMAVAYEKPETSTAGAGRIGAV